MAEKVFCVEKDGTIIGLHDDDFILGTQEITRASNVEHAPDGWYVQLTDDPLNGKWAGYEVGRGYATRAEALAAEVKFINENILSPQE